MTTILEQDEAELFDATQYDVPFPEADGHKVTDLTIRIHGLALKLNRHDPDHAALVESLTLGKYGRAEIVYSVEGKQQTVRVDDAGTEQVIHSAVLRIQTFDVKDDTAPHTDHQHIATHGQS